MRWASAFWPGADARSCCASRRLPRLLIGGGPPLRGGWCRGTLGGAEGQGTRWCGDRLQRPLRSTPSILGEGSPSSAEQNGKGVANSAHQLIELYESVGALGSINTLLFQLLTSGSSSELIGGSLVALHGFVATTTPLVFWWHICTIATQFFHSKLKFVDLYGNNTRVGLGSEVVETGPRP
jgi:hypothetical protein